MNIDSLELYGSKPENLALLKACLFLLLAPTVSIGFIINIVLLY